MFHSHIICNRVCVRYVNLFYGEVRHETIGSMTFKDEKNGLTCHFEFQAFDDVLNPTSNMSTAFLYRFDPMSGTERRVFGGAEGRQRQG